MNKNKLQIIKDDEIDVKALFLVLWNAKQTLIIFALSMTILGVIYSLTKTPLYMSTISIYPSESNDINQMTELRKMAHAFSIDTGNSEMSLDIGDIISSRNFQKKLIYNKWQSKKWDEPVDLIKFWKLNDYEESNDRNTNIENEWNAIEILENRIEFVKTKTGLFKISVWMEEKTLASDLANKIYSYLVEFINIAHINKAKMSREFIAKRLLEIKNKLDTAEDELKNFREKNRRVLESPQLQLDLGRLSRHVEIQTQLYITLQEQYELIKIKEMDETPNLIILDPAIPALYKDKPKRRIIVLTYLIFGIIFGLAFIFIRDLKRGQELSEG